MNTTAHDAKYPVPHQTIFYLRYPNAQTVLAHRPTPVIERGRSLEGVHATSRKASTVKEVLGPCAQTRSGPRDSQRPRPKRVRSCPIARPTRTGPP